MSFQLIDSIPVFGAPEEGAVKQIKNCLKFASHAALMADHHLGYAVPIGGVIAIEGAVSPSGVGYDIACGNKAVRLEVDAIHIKKSISSLMDTLAKELSFGVGRKNITPIESDIFEADPAWDIPFVKGLKDSARAQLGTIGSGNHYVDIFLDEQNRIWCGVHFGSRGLGHKIASHYITAAGGKDGMFVDPVVLDETSDLGAQYILAMHLAGRYAYAGRDWVCKKVAECLGAEIVEEVHNHHNFAWKEEHFGKSFWVVRKGATPCFPGQKGFVGGSMGDISVILKGIESPEHSHTLYSTVHGAGRVMSRSKAAGKMKWRKGKKVVVEPGAVTQAMMQSWIKEKGVELRGGGTDESPHCYKRLPEVLECHKQGIEILHTLTPIGVAMAGDQETDPYKD